ncbi:hypothetical protein J2TS4_27130 [Paenibacillus sp. J2TS4]|nr:hypothetical protein J2TS4_27130 [Paenibacillus sp. J2TS4]
MCSFRSVWSSDLGFESTYKPVKRRKMEADVELYTKHFKRGTIDESKLFS